MSKERLSSGVITSATFLHAIKENGGVIERSNHMTVLKMPSGYPYNQKISNCRQKGYITIEPLSAKRGHYTLNLTKAGEELIEKTIDDLQVYGDYDLFYIGQGRTAPNKHKQPENSYSPALLEAMREVQAVGADNERARKTIMHIVEIAEEYLQIEFVAPQGLQGALGKVAESTQEMHNNLILTHQKLSELI